MTAWATSAWSCTGTSTNRPARTRGPKTSAVEPSAAPFHDWNERITAECYRPNGWARVLDERGRVADIVNNYAHLSFNVGPTLMAWLERHRPDGVRPHPRRPTARAAAPSPRPTATPILPLCNDHDLRTQIRWGLADFEHRFGRRSAGLWLPETAVDDRVLAALVAEGVRLHDPGADQAAGAPSGRSTVDAPAAYRWFDGGDLDAVFYDGAISHDLAFGLTGHVEPGARPARDRRRRRRHAGVRRHRRRDVRPPPQVHRARARLRLRSRTPPPTACGS